MVGTEKGLVEVWSLESDELLEVIEVHPGSVKGTSHI